MKIPAFLGHLKTTNAVVTKIDKRGIYLSPNTDCTETTGCHTCSKCATQKPKHMLFYSAQNSPAYNIGQCLRITYFSLNEALAASIIFILPLVCAIAAYIGWSTYFSTAHDSPGAIFASVSALAMGFVLVYTIEKAVLALFPITIHTNTTQPSQ